MEKVKVIDPEPLVWQATFTTESGKKNTRMVTRTEAEQLMHDFPGVSVKLYTTAGRLQKEK